MKGSRRASAPSFVSSTMNQRSTSARECTIHLPRKVCERAANIESLGWTAESRIPYSQLRFSRDSMQMWGMQVWRNVDRRNEQDMWAFWRMNEYGGPAYFGTLEGIIVPSPPRQVEIVPYVTSR